MAIYFKGQEVGVVTELENNFDAGFWADMPDGLKGFSDLETIKITDDIFLIHNDAETAGVWRYKKSANDFLQLIDTSYTPSWYQVVGDTCLITSKTSQLAKAYKASTDNITDLGSFNNQPTTIYSEVVNNKCVVISSESSGNSPIYIYDSDDLTLTLGYSEQSRWRYLTTVGDKCLITGLINYAKGVLVYNSSDNTFNLIDNGIAALQVISSYDSTWALMSSTASSITGLYLIHLGDLTSTVIYTEGYAWTQAYAWNNWVLLSAGASKNQGLFLYNFTDPLTAPTTIYQTGYKYTLAKELEKNNAVILTCSSTTVYFDKENYTGLLAASKGNISNVYEDKSFVLLTGTGAGIYYFNIDTHQVSTLTTQGTYLSIIKSVGAKGNVLLNSSPTSTTSASAKPMFLYKASNNSVTQTSVKFIMDTLEDDGDNCIIKSSDTDCPYIFYYDDESESVILSKYRIDE